MFIPRIWFDEIERIGKQRCTPFGYALHGVGELVGVAGLIALIGIPAYLIVAVVVGWFRWSLMWLMTIPFALGIVGSVLVSISWSFAYRKHFRYDYENRVSSWVEEGRQQTYKYDDYQNEPASHDIYPDD